jgi:hypothetical protein
LYEDKEYDNLDYCSDNNATKYVAFLEMVVEACIRVAKANAFGFMYCSFQQAGVLSELLKKVDVGVQVCVVTRPKPNQAQLNRANTRAPLNVLDHALHLTFGNPTRANYGSKGCISFI